MAGLQPPVAGTSNYMNLEKEIFEDITASADILKIDDIGIGQKYSGYCWATKIICYQSGKDDSYTVSLQLVDGKGRRFRATFYGCDHFIEDKETPCFIEGTNYIPMGGKNRFWRLEHLVTSTISVSRELFIKDVENIYQHMDDFTNSSNALNGTPYYYILSQLLDKGYLNQIKGNVYKNNVGTSLGYGFKISNMLIANILQYQGFKVYDLQAMITAALLLHYQDKTYDELGNEVPKLMPISTDLYNIIMQSPLTDYQKGLLINILSEGEPINSSPERILFKKMLSVIEIAVQAEEDYIATDRKWK